MTGQEYEGLLNTYSKKSSHTLHLNRIHSRDALDEIMTVGKRNLDLLGIVNQQKPENQKLELWTPENTTAYPIEAPSISNRTLIRDRYDEVVRNLPQGLKDILIGGGELKLPSTISDDIYLEHARKLDRAYQSASRWLLQEPYLFSYEMRAKDDVRGFYHLSRDKDLNQKFEKYESLDEETKRLIKTSLIQMCRNNGVQLSNCKRRIDNAILEKSLTRLYDGYKNKSQALWDSFFKLGAKRRDVDWSSNQPQVATMPFQNPESPVVKQWLIDNIEDEWKWAGWQLKLNFTNSSWGTAHIVFVPGATPNVNGLAGNKITMDANRPIDHYSTRWTIRHEFGHVLGYPDGYIEFYDSEEQVMVNYQLDITDLMCSRRGKLKQVHFDEFKRNYFQT